MSDMSMATIMEDAKDIISDGDNEFLTDKEKSFRMKTQVMWLIKNLELLSDDFLKEILQLKIGVEEIIQ